MWSRSPTAVAERMPRPSTRGFLRLIPARMGNLKPMPRLPIASHWTRGISGWTRATSRALGMQPTKFKKYQRVVATDPATGQSSCGEVRGVWRRSNETIYLVQFDGRGGSSYVPEEVLEGEGEDTG